MRIGHLEKEPFTDGGGDSWAGLDGVNAGLLISRLRGSGGVGIESGRCIISVVGDVFFCLSGGVGAIDAKGQRVVF